MAYTLPSHSIIECGWTISRFSIAPTVHVYENFCAAQAAFTTSDPIFTFSFAKQYNSPDVHIHQSKLISAGGPLTALAERDFLEHASRAVSLSLEDCPLTIRIVRDYLYCHRINMQNIDIKALLNTISSVHRWQLIDLFRILCAFISKMCELKSVRAVLHAREVARLPDIPRSFKQFFWKSVAKNFHEISDFFASEENNPFEQPFPKVWDLALQHNMAASFIGYIREFVVHPRLGRGVHSYLLELVLIHLESRISDDEDLEQLINEQIIHQVGIEEPSFLFRQLATFASHRALRIATVSLSNGWNLKNTCKFPSGERAWATPIWCNGVQDSYDTLIRDNGFDVRVSHIIESRDTVSICAAAFRNSPFGPNRIQLIIRFHVSTCDCDGAPRVSSQSCDLLVNSEERCFQALSTDLSGHSQSPRCTVELWCKWTVIDG